MIKMVILVISIPKLPLLTADHILIISPVKKIGYTTSIGGVGTVIVKITATVRFIIHATVSAINLTG